VPSGMPNTGHERGDKIDDKPVTNNSKANNKIEIESIEDQAQSFINESENLSSLPKKHGCPVRCRNKKVQKTM